MGSKMPAGATGAMPSPNSHFSPLSAVELEHRLLQALGLSAFDLHQRNTGLTNIQQIGDDVVITAYAGGKFSTHVDKLSRFPSDMLIDKLRLLF